jgi:glycosidase
MFKKNIIFIFLIVSVLTNFLFAETEIKNENNLWFKNAVFYQIFVGAFKDSDGDGYGDFNGLTSKLDYIKSLGINAIYLNPIFESYQTDEFTRYNLGYDVIDFKKVNPKYGTLEDFKTLLEEAHKRDIKIILDFITMGVSVQNIFFQDIQTNPNSPYKDWFILKQEAPKETWLSYGYSWNPIGMPTNDKEKKMFYFFSLFGANGTKIIKKENFENINTDIDKLYSLLLKEEYIYHTPKNDEISYYYFTKNLEKDFQYLGDKNIKILKQIFEKILTNGKLSGTVSLNYKNPEVVDYILSVADFWLELGTDGFRCDAAKYIIFNGAGKELQEHQPETFDFWKKFKKNMLRHGADKVLIGEIIPIPTEHDYIGKNRELFDLLYDGVFAEAIYNRTVFFQEMFSEGFNGYFYENKFPNNRYLIYNSNHDKERIAGKLVYKDSTAEKKLVASILLLSNGIPMLYYGDELGLNNYGENFLKVGCLSTMTFDTSTNSGFSTANKITPPLSLNGKENNVETLTNNPDSLLNYYKQLIQLRHKYKIFASGFRKKHKQINPKIYSYILYNHETSVLILHNLNHESKNITFNLDDIITKNKFSLKKILGDVSFKVKNKKLYLKNFGGYQSLVFEIIGTTSKDFQNLEVEPDFENAEKIKTNKQYISLYQNKIYKLPIASADKILGLKLKPQKNTKILFYDSLEKEKPLRNAINLIPTKKEQIIPFANNCNYFNLDTKNIKFEIIELDISEYFSKKTKEIMRHDANKTLKAFAYGVDKNFWYFKIEKEKLILPQNSGLDFCMFIHDKKNKTGIKQIGFWLLHGIHTKNIINNLLIYQKETKNNKPLLFTNITQANQPGIKKEDSVIFQETNDAFYLEINKKDLPMNNYKIGLCVWSASGEWGDKPPAKEPIVEMLPYNEEEMKKQYPYHIDLIDIKG